MRLSRHCYDKAHRCPGWAGGGWKYPKGEDRCNGGHIDIDYTNRWTRNWRFHRCDTCDVVCWPIILQELDPTYWRHWHWYRLKNWFKEHVVWLAQYNLVAGLEALCGWIDKIPVLQRDDAGKWQWVSSCWGCYPLRLATLSNKLDVRWNTGAWTSVPEEERQDSDHEVF